MGYMGKDVDISVFVGKTFKSVVIEKKNEEILFTDSSGTEFRMHHDQDCCESVYIEDIAGDLQDLVGSPILQAEESSNSDAPPKADPDLPDYRDESYTWTFYRLATVKGYVTIRWYGSSNGYYGESVSVEELIRA